MNNTSSPINEEAARRAKSANSLSDYTPGSATAEYNRYVEEATEIAEWQKGRVDPMYHEKIDSLLAAYCRKLAANMNQGFAIDSRVPSVLIAGPSNFPVRQKEKQNQARRRNMEEYRYIQGLLEKIKSVGMGGISSDDPNALPKLKEKLEALEQSQETMKAVNAYYRKHKTLDGCPHLSEDAVNRLKADMVRNWRGANARPFEAYALTNNNANIHRVQDRIKSMERAQEKPAEGWAFDGGEVVINREINRLQILFDEKPDEVMRSALKCNGFKWAPSQKAWQRQLTDNALYAMKQIGALIPVKD